MALACFMFSNALPHTSTRPIKISDLFLCWTTQKLRCTGDEPYVYRVHPPQRIRETIGLQALCAVRRARGTFAWLKLSRSDVGRSMPHRIDNGMNHDVTLTALFMHYSYQVNKYCHEMWIVCLHAEIHLDHSASPTRFSLRRKLLHGKRILRNVRQSVVHVYRTQTWA